MEATMEMTGAPRRSSRPTIRPVKFWDFEKPDYSKPDHITYKISDLTNFLRTQKSVNGTIKKSFSNTKLSKEKAEGNESKKLSEIDNKRAPKKSDESSDKEGTTQQVAPKDRPNTNSTTNGQQTVGSSYSTPLSSKQKRLVRAFQKKIKDHISLPSASCNVIPSTTPVINATNERRRSGRIRTKSLELQKRKLDQAPPDDKSPPKKKRSSEKQPKKVQGEKSRKRASLSQEQEKGSLSKGSHDQDFESEMKKVQKSLTGIAGSSFRNLFFQRYQTKDCVCYLAKSFNNSKMGVFTGFVFLEHGNLVWCTKMNIFIMVVGGRGRVKIMDIPTKDGISLPLVHGTKFTVAPGMRAEITKHARTKLLKMFVQLTPQSSSGDK